ncbi:lytic transglycosylase domain-containing protein [Ornithinimicrobium avium]|uniref:lytic transglycosylase domain-containing protein n=1 Tax=Ornithinimicrobium avium TaxID=2283195 RepID=UPI0013B46034|nr:lytic transglycosylase domain-containing protein [Ornithinimicrobium avium]
MSPLFAAMPPADLPTVAYVPSALHSSELVLARTTGTHTVRSGDTVYGIAARYGVSAQSVVRANGLKDGGRWILPGTTLLIPGKGGPVVASPPGSPAKSSTAGGAGTSSRGSGGTVTVRHGDTLSHIAVRHGTTVAALASTNGLRDTRIIYPGQLLRLPGAAAPGRGAATEASRSTSSGKASSSGSGGTVTVRSGDTLSGIAARHGTSVSALTRANGISSSAFIHPGQKLRLPGGASSAGPGTSSSSSKPATVTRPYDASTIGDYKKGEKVQDTFLHYRYSDGVARSAAANREYLASIKVPSRDAMKTLIVSTSKRHGVDSKLMLALSYQESGWNMRAVSPANAIGAMQVIPTSGQWASSLVGRELNLLDPADNVEAGVVIMKTLLSMTDKDDHAIAGYYQGLGSVRQHGLFPDSKQYVRNIRYFMTTL